MRKYQIINRKNSPALKEYLVKEDQVLLPFVESIERGRTKVEGLGFRGRDRSSGNYCRPDLEASTLG